MLKISSEELKRPAKRPGYSVMRNYMLELKYNYQTRTLEEALREYFKG